MLQPKSRPRTTCQYSTIWAEGKMVSYSNKVRKGRGKKHWLEILSNPASFRVFTLVTVANNPTPNLPEIMSNIHERGLTLAKKLSNSDTSNDNQKGLSCAVTMGRWRREALSVTRLNASHWFANDETIYTELHDSGKKKIMFVCLSPEEIACFSTV